MKEEKKVIEINIDDILPNRFQPRIKFKESALNELSKSIKDYGVLQPIIVRPIGDKYEIIAGERRYKASVLANKTTIPCIISDLDDKESAEIALIENVQREDLTPIEEAISYQKIFDMSYLTQNELADKLDKNQSTIANKLRLLNLEIEVQEALLDEKISERHARSLLKVKDRTNQIEILNKIINERLTVRKTDEVINKILKDKEEKVEIEMEKENIPTTPIIEENPIIEETQASENFTEIPVESLSNEPPKEEIIDGNINPGFMDIDKIETEAADIYQEKPTADIDYLLKSDPMIENTEDKEENKEETKEEDFNNIFNFNNNRFFNFTETEEKEEEESVATDKSTVIDELENNDFDFNEYFTPIESSKDTEPVKEEDFALEKLMNNEDSIDIIDFDNDFEITPIESNKIPDFDFNFDEEPEIYKSSDESEPINLESESMDQKSDFRSVINTIRNSSKEIENLGYIIDVEELDFENSYQVIFKINK